MPLKSWLSFGTAQKTPYQTDALREPIEDSELNCNPEIDAHRQYITPSFDDIVSRFNDLNNEVARLQKESEAQKRQTKDYLTQIENDRDQHRRQSEVLKSQIQNDHDQHQKQSKAYKSQVADLKKQLNQEKQNVESLQMVIANKRNIAALKQQGPVKGFKQVLQNERATSGSQAVESEKRFDRSQHENMVLRGQVKNLATKIEELKLDVEFLKCTASPPIADVPESSAVADSNVPLTEAPFVLVLVDGDAYKFAEMLPNPYLEPQTHPATRMAQNIKTHLQAYIRAHNLPPHCRLMVRVLANGSGLRGGKLFGFHHRNGKAAEAVEDFMIRFTEFAPMFEFFDAGSGKERVDSKIHELYHTFLPNPACHKIFLATARDNGFARMIEQNIHHPTARAKTCLIGAGDVAAEIARLDLEIVEWPSVFARQFPPKEVIAREAKREHRRLREEENVNRERDTLIRQLGTKGYEDHVKRKSFQTLTKEMMGHKTAEHVVRDLVSMDKRKLGVRAEMSLKWQASLEAAVDDSDSSHHDEHWCAEVGVD